MRRALGDLGFRADEIDLETTANGNVGGFLVSERFAGVSQIERQRQLWDELRGRVRPAVLDRIVSLLTMTPAEVDDDVRPTG